MVLISKHSIYHCKKNIISDVDLNNKKFNVIYVGAIRPVNNVGTILNAVLLLKEYDGHSIFNIWRW